MGREASRMALEEFAVAEDIINRGLDASLIDSFDKLNLKYFLLMKGFDGRQRK